MLFRTANFHPRFSKGEEPWGIFIWDDILSVRIKQPILTNLCIIWIFIFISNETKRAEYNNKKKTFPILFCFHLYIELRK